MRGQLAVLRHRVAQAQHLLADLESGVWSSGVAMKVWELRVQGLEFRVEGLGIGVKGSGFRVQA